MLSMHVRSQLSLLTSTEGSTRTSMVSPQYGQEISKDWVSIKGIKLYLIGAGHLN